MQLASVFKQDILLCLRTNTVISRVFCLTFLTITTLFCFHLIFYYTSFNYIPEFKHTTKGRETCNLFHGHWVPDLRGPVYSNYSCKTIPDKRNCFLHGRKDVDFLNWRWKPNNCELRRFDPRRFLAAVKGKKMAFIGDSLARNQMDSLLCLLSSVSPFEPVKFCENSSHLKILKVRAYREYRE